MSTGFQDNKERDLFEQVQISDRKIKRKTRFLLTHLKDSVGVSYENIVFLVIAFIMSCIVSFSLGVEKGRQDIGHVDQQRVTKYSKEVSQVKPRKSKEDLRPVEEKVSGNKYIVQLAAFKKKEAAQQELEKLEKMGSRAYIRQSGSYYQLYVGTFDNKEKAQMILKELKNTYKDCYIKEVER
ncbi:MAG: SPOR domain-containing protein [Candidatus Omnitrophica bacterium]|nr:SPOR domain-containing protein [Candidatus Omnitrophota bacterium]